TVPDGRRRGEPGAGRARPGRRAALLDGEVDVPAQGSGQRPGPDVQPDGGRDRAAVVHRDATGGRVVGSHVHRRDEQRGAGRVVGELDRSGRPRVARVLGAVLQRRPRGLPDDAGGEQETDGERGDHRGDGTPPRRDGRPPRRDGRPPRRDGAHAATPASTGGRSGSAAGDPASTIRSRPDSLARYSAASAALITSTGVAPWPGYTPTPMLAVTGTGPSALRIDWWTRAATATATSSSAPSTITANSSPPYRAARSPSRQLCAMDRAAVRSTWSPTR